jgi:hypothetical protein
MRSGVNKFAVQGENSDNEDGRAKMPLVGKPMLANLL